MTAADLLALMLGAAVWAAPSVASWFDVARLSQPVPVPVWLVMVLRGLAGAGVVALVTVPNISRERDALRASAQKVERAARDDSADEPAD